MCEMLAVKSQVPLPIERILEYAVMLEEYGVGGFNWGIVWKSVDGGLSRYRSSSGVRNDLLAPRSLAGIESTDYFVHLRRPSLMNSISHRNAQPYLSSDRSMAFAHNGYFQNHDQIRPEFQAKLEGTSDSEIGFWQYDSLLKAGEHGMSAVGKMHEVLGGIANIGVLRDDGEFMIYAAHPENRVYTFELGKLKIVSTALHSHDDFLFQAIFPEARNIELMPLHTVLTL